MRDINGSKPTSFPLDEEKLSFKIPLSRPAAPGEDPEAGQHDHQPHWPEGHR